VSQRARSDERSQAAAVPERHDVEPSPDVIVFGAGYAGSRVCEAACRRKLSVVAVVRGAQSAERLHGRGFEVSVQAATHVAKKRVGPNTHAIITFPPDGSTDAALAPLLSRARAVSYLSTTGVYQELEGVIDDETALPHDTSDKYGRVLFAEEQYRRVGAAVLRSPGIYGPDRGIHLRLRRGEFKLSGDGSGYGSRIHVEDLAELLLASARTPGETFVVGDLEPTRQRDMVTWLCEKMGVAFPPSAPMHEVHETLRRNRRVDPSRALLLLGVSLKYPSYREGYAP
jgi:nucleoside-diphosphate-sugar epimerase